MKYLPLESAEVGRSGYQQHVKEGNIKCIFDLVRDGKCKSRAEIVRAMRLSATSVSVLVEELASRGLIDEAGPTLTALPGRRPISLRLNADAHQLAVFSIQRTGVRYTLLNLSCEVLESRLFPLDVSGLSQEAAEAQYLKLFEDILKRRSKKFSRSRALMVGICFPGVYILPDRQFYTAPTLGFSISDEVAQRLQKRINLPIYMLNSTRSLAYAEKKRLEAAGEASEGAEDMLFVRIQEDIHCAIISGGDIYTGPFNISGELGHITIDHRGRPCRCGSRGCLERYASLAAIMEDAQAACRAAGIEPPETPEDLARRYPDEPVLLEAVNQSAEMLASGLYSLLCTSGIRRIVLGGDIEVLGANFLKQVYLSVCARGLLIRHLDLSYAQANPDAECIGIAHHFLDKVYTITT